MPADQILQCRRCVMDSSDPDLGLDSQGVCRYCRGFSELQTRLPRPEEGESLLSDIATRIRSEGKGRDYDCVLGLSGGLDSSYAAAVAHRFGLRPLVVHFDNGWNSELAVQNIENVVTGFDFDLDTHVVDWATFADLQRSYLRASVIDIEVPTDHAIAAVLHDVARREKVRWIFSGNNMRTEYGMPRTWSHRKSDLRNLRAIHRAHGTVPLDAFPQASTLKLLRERYVRGVTSVYALDYVPYDRQQAAAELEAKIGWRNYGGKHHESFFTRFYQAHVLPTKFGIDKRRVHLSALVRCGQLTREAAAEQLQRPVYDAETLEFDRDYVLKKLGLSRSEWDTLMATPPRPHSHYASDESYIRPLFAVKALSRRLKPGRRRAENPEGQVLRSEEPTRS